jgi:hypothetical protein
VALHTNNNTTIKSVAPHCYAYQKDDDNYNDKKKQRKKERKKK